MRLRYREDRATQAAAHLLNLRGDRMSYMKLLKLLYFADRRALLELGRPITYDRFYSMPHGPVLSRTYDLMVGEPDPEAPSYWREYISAPLNYEVRLVKPAPNDQLSEAQELILDDVFKEFGHLDRWTVSRESHKLPEYRADCGSSSIPIDISEILSLEGMSPEEAEAVQESIAAEECMDQLLD